MTQRQVTLKDECGFVMLEKERFIGHVYVECILSW